MHRIKLHGRNLTEKAQWVLQFSSAKNFEHRKIGFVWTLQAPVAFAPGGARLGLMPQLLREGLVAAVHLSLDKLVAATGD